MAWTTLKQQIIKDMLQERVYVEIDPQKVQQWSLTRSWMEIINSHVTDAIKQAVLNDLIDDKIVYYNYLIDKNSAENTAFADQIAQGLGLKE